MTTAGGVHAEGGNIYGYRVEFLRANKYGQSKHGPFVFRRLLRKVLCNKVRGMEETKRFIYRSLLSSG